MKTEQQILNKAQSLLEEARGRYGVRGNNPHMLYRAMDIIEQINLLFGILDRPKLDWLEYLKDETKRIN